MNHKTIIKCIYKCNIVIEGRIITVPASKRNKNTVPLNVVKIILEKAFREREVNTYKIVYQRIAKRRKNKELRKIKKSNEMISFIKFSHVELNFHCYACLELDLPLSTLYKAVKSH
ncbi:MAG: hypothetical protein ACTSP4_08485 [Candidatus Hodarchaeales archaeon]